MRIFDPHQKVQMYRKIRLLKSLKGNLSFYEPFRTKRSLYKQIRRLQKKLPFTKLKFYLIESTGCWNLSFFRFNVDLKHKNQYSQLLFSGSGDLSWLLCWHLEWTWQRSHENLFAWAVVWTNLSVSSHFHVLCVVADVWNRNKSWISF